MYKKMVKNILNGKDEIEMIKKIIKSLKFSEKQKVLDVGCGYGDKMLMMCKLNINVVGVDINEAAVEYNKKKGLLCYSVKEFNASIDKYDLILLSHVIEHFMPADLLKFMDFYLDRLKEGGYLLIATPLLSDYFYDDFDHVKPYYPTGINLVFCSEATQVQYHSKNKLKCLNIWFRRSPIKRVFGRDIYVYKKPQLSLIVNIIFAILFKYSFKLFGQTDGWIGLYKKVGI